MASQAISIAASAKLHGRLYSTMGACDTAALAVVDPSEPPTEDEETVAEQEALREEMLAEDVAPEEEMLAEQEN